MVWCCFAAQNLTKCAAELHRFFVTHKNGGCLLRVLITSLVGGARSSAAVCRQTSTPKRFEGRVGGNSSVQAASPV